MLSPLYGSMGALGVATRRAVAFDADAQAFIDAAGLTNAGQKSALNKLVVALKAASLWTKMLAVYPFVGGTAAAHKWNLKDPRDLDAAFRLTFSGAWAHAANGIRADAATTHANTHLGPATSLSPSSGSFGVYSLSADAAGGTWYDMGSGASDSAASMLICRYSNSRAYWCYGGDASFTYNTDIDDGSGLFVVNRQNGTTTEGWRNGVKIGQGARSVNLSASPVFIGALDVGGSAVRRSGRTYAFAFVSSGLSDSENVAFYAAVQAFQTALGRQV
ncbi:MAG: hypothetical protein M9944_08110 [Rhizobiaceae bacterium]|nr:hypothetical protein [Rhizobiaceae bacterium]